MGSHRRDINFGLAFESFSRTRVFEKNPLILKKDNWREIASEIDGMGYSGFFIPDHFNPQFEPIATMAAIAAVTKKIDVGSIVCCVDYRHPVIYAKASATINLISNNRHILGIGAGWDEGDYAMAGIPYDPWTTRIRRLEEAIKIIKGMWTQESTSLEGEYYRVKNLRKAVDELEYARPRLLIGGGGNTILKMAGRHADVANLSGRLLGGEDRWHKWIIDGSYENLGKKVETVKKAAVAFGRDPDDIVYSQWVPLVRMYGDQLELKKEVAKRYGATLDEVNDCAWVMADEPGVVVENIKRSNEDYGISHYIIDGGTFSSLDGLRNLYEKVIKPLS
jgi:probable F420-dependent oxidoreductase